mgnify:FL=1
MTATIRNLSWEQYFALPALSSTGARRIVAESPFHYRFGESTDSAAMRLGRAVHMLALESDLFAEKFQLFVPEKGTGSRAANDEAKATAAAAGITLLTETQWDRALKMRDAIRNHPTANALIEGATLEESIEWTDPETGCPCKARLDIQGAGCVTDIKTARSASLKAFSKSVASYGYHMQAAWYLDAAKAKGAVPNAFRFIVIESKAPFAIAVYTLAADAIQLGRNQNANARRTYTDCTARGYWPGYPVESVEIDLPDWSYTDALGPDAEAEDDLL